MAYPAAVIANYFIKKAKQANQPLSPMKLLKLVYLAHGWHLALEHEPLIDEPIVAWQFGPVIDSLYQQFKKFGNNPITELAPISNPTAEECLNATKVAPAILDRVWEVYGNYSAIQLSNLTHKPGSPWDIAWHEEEGKNMRNHCIKNSVIQSYFSEQAAKHNS